MSSSASCRIQNRVEVCLAPLHQRFVAVDAPAAVPILLAPGLVALGPVLGPVQLDELIPVLSLERILDECLFV
jgi:hypothetical protein